MADQDSLPPEVVREQLKKILQCPEFRASSSLANFLRFVVEEALAGRADQIKGYTVAVGALGRPRDFDPEADTIVRVHAGRLRTALCLYYSTAGSQDPVVIEMPRGAYRPLFHWRRSVDGRETRGWSGPASPQSSDPSRLPGAPSLLILPFKTLAEDAEQVHLADGLVQALAVALARNPELLVIGPVSRERARAIASGTQALAQWYGAQFVLDGHFGREGGRIRTSVRLTDMLSGGTLWAETFDSADEHADFFVFEDAVVCHSAAVLGDTYGIIHRVLTQRAIQKPVDRLEVYEAVLRYYHYSWDFPEEARSATHQALERTVALHPDNPVTLALLGDLYLLEYLMGGDQVALHQAEALINRALALDPESCLVRFPSAGLSFVHRDRDLLIRETEHVLAAGPNRPDLMQLCGFYLALAGEWERGMPLIDKARLLTPHLPTNYRIASFLHLFWAGQYREALAEAQVLRAPGLFWGPLLRSAALTELGRMEEAAAALRRLIELRPDFPTRGWKLMKRWLFSNENVEALLGSLYKAGLNAEIGLR